MDVRAEAKLLNYPIRHLASLWKQRVGSCVEKQQRFGLTFLSLKLAQPIMSPLKGPREAAKTGHSD